MIKAYFFIIPFCLIALHSYTQNNTVDSTETSRFNILFAGKSGGVISAYEVCEKPVLFVKNSQVQVVSYSFVLVVKGLVTQEKINGSEIPEKICSLLKGATTGSKFFINEIMAKTTSGEIMQLKNLSFEVL
jgi:hypothetical protein